MTYYLAIFVPLVIVALVMLVLQMLGSRRQRLLTRILDEADALEQLLHRTRHKMADMQQVVQRVPSDIGAVANASLQSVDVVQQGLRDVLEHRLWLAKHAAEAPTHELRAAEQALVRSHARIAEQLAQLESTGAELAQATDAALQQAQREPASLRRSQSDS